MLFLQVLIKMSRFGQIFGKVLLHELICQTLFLILVNVLSKVAIIIWQNYLSLKLNIVKNVISASLDRNVTIWSNI